MFSNSKDPSKKELKEITAHHLLDEINNKNLSAATLKNFTDLSTLSLIAYQLFTQTGLEVIKKELDHGYRGAQINQPRDKLYKLIQDARVFYKLASGVASKEDKSADDFLNELIKLKNTSQQDRILTALIDRIYELASIKTDSKQDTDFFAIIQNKMPPSLKNIISSYAVDNVIQLMNADITAIDKVDDVTVLALVFNALLLRTSAPKISELFTKERNNALIPKDPDEFRNPPELGSPPSPGSGLFYRIYHLSTILLKIETGKIALTDLEKLATTKEDFYNPEEVTLIKKYKLDKPYAVFGIRNYSANQINEQYGMDKEMLELLAKLGNKGAITLVGDQSEKETNFFRVLINKIVELAAPKNEHKLGLL